MATDTQDKALGFTEAFPLDNHMAGLRVEADPAAYPYTFFRPYGDSYHSANAEAATGSDSLTLAGMWIDGTPGTLTVGRTGMNGAWTVQGRTPAGHGLSV